MAEPGQGGRWIRLIPSTVMVAAVLVWLWPIGLGGRMLVGGDPTQFSMGLMAFLKSSLIAARLPLWNDLWGFGFPALAESQMGVYYPPHLLFYRCFSTEVAYPLILVLHTLWGALGTRWAARRFGVSEIGGCLAGFTFATSGFALIHLSHQWAYTVGSWMPWALGLTWMIARSEGTRQTPWTLAAVLTLQVLPGHFQLAFVTQISCLVLALASGRRAIRSTVVVGLSLVGMGLLGAMQMWPTFQLSRLSASQRDYEYLSCFSATPLHLISYVAPGLFHWSPLWRAMAWDKFRTAPEEYLGYVGLVPLFLATGATLRGWRINPAVRALLVLAIATLLLSLGPYVPGYSQLIRLPGFSFFRAPARWGLGTAFGLSILAGVGFDQWKMWPQPGRSLARFALVAVGLTLLVILGFEVGLAAARGPDSSSITSLFDRIVRFLPGKRRAGQDLFRAIMSDAFRPMFDGRVLSAMARTGVGMVSPPGPSLADSRFAIYRQELGDSGLLILGLLGVSVLARNRPRSFTVALLVLTLADSLLMASHRPFDFGPIQPLIGQSPVLTRLAEEPRGKRTLDLSQNLFLIARAAPASAYRTLDLPSPGGLLSLARGPADDPRTAEALRAAGIDFRLLDQAEGRSGQKFVPRGWDQGQELIVDPALAGWLYGVDLARISGLREFTMLRSPTASHQAWLITEKSRLEADGMADPSVILDTLRLASPLPIRSNVPEEAEVDVKLATSGYAMVVLSRTFDPEWDAWWISESGERRPAEVVKVLGGWQGVRVPEPGRWTLHLNYSGRSARLGLTISSVAWSVWMMAFWRLRKTPAIRNSDG